MRPMGAELFHADGRTDMTELIVAFRNFSNAPKSPPNARNFCQVIYIMTLVRLHLLHRCNHCYGKKDESSVTGQNSPYLHNNYEYTPKTIWIFCGHNINWQGTGTRQTISLDARLKADFLATRSTYEYLKFSPTISSQIMGKIIPDVCGPIYKVPKERNEKVKSWRFLTPFLLGYIKNYS